LLAALSYRAIPPYDNDYAINVALPTIRLSPFPFLLCMYCEDNAVIIILIVMLSSKEQYRFRVLLNAWHFPHGLE